MNKIVWSCLVLLIYSIDVDVKTIDKYVFSEYVLKILMGFIQGIRYKSAGKTPIWKILF